MLTQCPNPLCKLCFDVPDDREGRNGPCPACGQVITYRSLSVIREIERQHDRRTRAASASPSRERGLFSAVLENIRSLWNVGSIFRTADGAGFAPLYLCGITGCPPHKAIAKTSLGAEKHIRWEHHASALDVLPRLSAQGVQVVALEQTPASEPLQAALARGAIKPPLCLLVGNEVAGISAETLAQASLHCHLPMRGIKASLNVAVAFGIAAYAIRERTGAISSA
ncbi:MAG: TrmH family RNA methyltransferase [Planctomycetota bacterium]|nr:TrmH family RNA methyltransferase [Planctomycetota bacterium]